MTPEVALTATNEKITLVAETDAGSAPTLVLDITGAGSGTANDFVHITGDDAGFYSLELAAADVNRLGRMMLAITDAANHCPVFHEFMVLPAVVYDAMILGTDLFDVSVTQIAGAAVSTSTAQLGVNAVQHGGTAQTGRDIGASVLLSSGTGTGQVSLAAGLVDITQTAADKVWSTTVRTLSAAGVQAIWDALTSALTTAGSVGKRIADFLTGDAFVRLGAPAGASHAVDVAAVKADTAAILVDTGTTLDGRLPAALVGGRMDANASAIGGDATAATNLRQSALTIYVGSVTGAATTTTLVDSGLTQANDHWIGRVLIFTSGALAKQATTITDFVAATDTLTFTALTAAPSGGDTYVIV